MDGALMMAADGSQDDSGQGVLQLMEASLKLGWAWGEKVVKLVSTYPEQTMIAVAIVGVLLLLRSRSSKA